LQNLEIGKAQSKALTKEVRHISGGLLFVAAAVSCCLCLLLPRVTMTSVDQYRVLHVVNGEHFSGAERVQSHLGRVLPQFGITADFACVKPGKFAAKLAEQEGRWGKSLVAEMKGRFDLRAAFRLASMAVGGGYDCLHAHTPRTAMIASLASWRTGIPWIYHVHSPAARDSSRAFVNRMNAWIERNSLRNCRALITVSNSLRADCIASGHAADRVHVVHNGVPAICPPRQVFPQVGSAWTIGMVALMRPRKGLEIVLDALARLRSQGHDLTLRCIGPYETPEYRAGIDDQIKRLNVGDAVIQEGFVDDVPAKLLTLDAMILPSLYGEGLPMVVLEAMAAAVPVIATSVEGTPEAIRHGVEGLLARPGDAKSLAAEIESLMTGKVDWHQMAQAAKTRHAENFSDHAMAKATAEVYHKILAS
jgi:glycosyltransferase involved in cell wall biosynthesis